VRCIPPAPVHSGAIATEVHLSPRRPMVAVKRTWGRGVASAAMATVLLASGCDRGPTEEPTTPRGASPSSVAPSSAAALPVDCSDASPCPVAAGTYNLGEAGLKDAGAVPGLELALPEGWSIVENTGGELSLTPPGRPSDRLFLWLDLVPVKSTGPGHGTTVLYNVGTTPDELIGWLTSNRDFRIVEKPTPDTVGADIPVRNITVGVSAAARYGDSDCPANPRCADLFTKPGYWGGGFYGIGGEEEVRLYLGTVRLNEEPHTLLIGLDAVNHADLGWLVGVVRPILESFRLPG
jgi:hypothetical protein